MDNVNRLTQIGSRICDSECFSNVAVVTLRNRVANLFFRDAHWPESSIGVSPRPLAQRSHDVRYTEEPYQRTNGDAKDHKKGHELHVPHGPMGHRDENAEANDHYRSHCPDGDRFRLRNSPHRLTVEPDCARVG